LHLQNEQEGSSSAFLQPRIEKARLLSQFQVLRGGLCANLPHGKAEFEISASAGTIWSQTEDCGALDAPTATGKGMATRSIEPHFRTRPSRHRDAPLRAPALDGTGGSEMPAHPGPVIFRDDLASRKNGSRIRSAMFGKLANGL
jgi:hypothetical protein